MISEEKTPTSEEMTLRPIIKSSFMVSTATFTQMTLSFPQTKEQPHFEKTSFRVKKKIFATLSLHNKEAVIKLSVIDQSVFCSIDKTIIYPVKGAWGKQGWTIIKLKKIKKTLLEEALACAYGEVSKIKP